MSRASGHLRAGFNLYQTKSLALMLSRQFSVAAFVTNDGLLVEVCAQRAQPPRAGGTMRGCATVVLVCSLALSVWGSQARASSLSSLLGQGRFADLRLAP